jgi:hypothetical protein
MAIDVSKDRSAFVFKIKQAKTTGWDYVTVELKEIRSFERSIRMYKSTQPKKPQDLNLQRRCKNLTITAQA